MVREDLIKTWAGENHVEGLKRVSYVGKLLKDEDEAGVED